MMLPDNVAAFAKECVVASHNYIEKDVLLEAYCQYCKYKKEKPLGKNVFGQRLGILGYQTYRLPAGDRNYVWEGISLKKSQ